MQKCNVCGKEIRYIATGLDQSIVCNAEKFDFVTENGRKTSGYLIHNCNKYLEAENGKNEK